MSESFNKLNSFLSGTLEGFECLQWLYKGDLEKVLRNPQEFTLNHVGMDIDAWVDEDRVLFELNDGLHYVFTPAQQEVNGLKFVNGGWE